MASIAFFSLSYSIDAHAAKAISIVHMLRACVRDVLFLILISSPSIVFFEKRKKNHLKRCRIISV